MSCSRRKKMDESTTKLFSHLLIFAVMSVVISLTNAFYDIEPSDGSSEGIYQDTFSEMLLIEEIYSEMEAQQMETASLVDELLLDERMDSNRSKRDATVQFRHGSNCFMDRCSERKTVLIPGPTGPAGSRGATGTTGERGPKGESGDEGPTGDRGDIGNRGEQGDEGEPGERGINGARGSPGLTGATGVRGQRGDKGYTGSRTTSKAVYTRWGSNTCPDTATLVYEGYAAGAYYDQKGGGADYVCLPRNPTYDRPDAGVNTWRAYMYGAEYEVVNFPPFSGLDNGDVPCAVCSVSERSVTFMQPARIDCPDGWTREYYGYLMAQSYIYYRSEWACVDHSATLTSSSSTGNSDGALFYPTEVHCGNSNTGLPCEDFVNGYELTCSVCSR